MTVWIQNPFDNLPVEGYRPQRYWLMARAFAAAGHRVTLWTSDFSHASKAPRVLRTACEEPFALRLIPTLPYPKNVCRARIRSHRAYARSWLALADAVAESDGRPDLVVTSLPPLATGDAAIAIKETYGAKLVVDMMDAWPETFRRLFPKPVRPLADMPLLPLRRAANRAFRAADLVTGVCDAYETIARTHGAAAYRRFFHGISGAAAAAASVRARPLSGAPRLVYAGNLGRGYDLGTVIDAVKETPGATLDIAGAGDFEAKWRARAHGDVRIRFHGYVGADALGALLDAADVGVIPLADDTFVGLPYKLGDYALHALRVVTSLGGECAALLARHRAGRTYSDVPTLKAAMQEVGGETPDFPALLAELDADAIYAAYVACATAL